MTNRDAVEAPAGETALDARGAIDEMAHPLVDAPHGFREYPNQKPWPCRFCESVIPPGAGYWGSRRRISGSRDYAKMCSSCFLKFLLVLEENPHFSKVLKQTAVKRLA